MAWTCDWASGDRVALITVTGVIDEEVAMAIRGHVTTLIDNHGITGCLGDFTECDQVPSIQFQMTAAIRSPRPLGFRRAFLVAGDRAAELQAYETSAVNRMHMVRIFTDRDEAMNWLAEAR